MKKILINLGCGNKDFGSEWTHIDSIKGPHISSHDISKLPVKNNSVDLIYSSNVLEYFDREESLSLLKEWYGKLKIGGKLYLSVPDFEVMSKLYSKDNVPLHKLIGPLYGKMVSGDKTIFHKTVWDYSSLGEYMRIAGFRRIDKWDDVITEDENGLERIVDRKNDCSNAKINGKQICLNIFGEKNEYEGKK